MAALADNLIAVRERIHAACVRVGRDTHSVELLAVSKTMPAELIREAYAAGQTLFGESRQQEAAAKIDALPAALRWHFIGRVQRNKVRKLLPAFEVIHAIDSLSLATYTAELAGELGLFPKIFLQVNVAGEAAKGGFAPDVLRAEIATLLELPRIEILGLMTIPPAAANAEIARPWFARLRELRDSIECEFAVRLPALSMGMSGDYEVAIEEGATHVRVGSAIFGKRTSQGDGQLG
ncbi:MAG: YggS family pyridoxal phosphate-dependent enzyme [Verrucomicrobia bacterium]|nr:MAG: YggS family pyridoxal phosphate-dependent enzyme [Verrucomicrobiota bacterium]